MAVMVERSTHARTRHAAETGRLVVYLFSLLLVLLVLVRPLLASAFGGSPNLRFVCDGEDRRHSASAGFEAAYPRMERRHGFVTVTGEARWLGDRELGAPIAIVELRERTGGLLRVERALLNAETMRPGMCATYRVVVPDHTAAAQLRVAFSELRGTRHAARWVEVLSKE